MKGANTGKILLLASIAAFVFYLVGFVILKDVYRYPVVGALFELLFLPMLLLLVIVPVISMLSFFRNFGWLKIYSILSLVFISGAVLILVIRS